MEKIIKLEFEKETKGTLRFKEIAEENENPIVGTIYIRKEFLKEKRPKQIEIALRIEE